MDPTPRPRVKICCIASLDEMWLAVHHGASAVGLVSAMPSGPGPISDALIHDIAVRVPPGVSAFLLTCRQNAGAVVAQLRLTGCNTVQLCDELPIPAYADIRTAVPNVRIVQVIHVTGEKSIAEAERVALHVDAILLDSGRPDLAMKELGGTGRVHDWSVSRAIRQRVDVPLYLAGGLKAENVADAIRAVAPFGVDVCSGVRTDGKLDERKLVAFMAAASG
jgi:phosphoribosylanthranilate isomerase